jgi:hypothetical protein
MTPAPLAMIVNTRRLTARRARTRAFVSRHSFQCSPWPSRDRHALCAKVPSIRAPSLRKSKSCILTGLTAWRCHKRCSPMGAMRAPAPSPETCQCTNVPRNPEVNSCQVVLCATIHRLGWDHAEAGLGSPLSPSVEPPKGGEFSALRDVQWRNSIPLEPPVGF